MKATLALFLLAPLSVSADHYVGGAFSSSYQKLPEQAFANPDGARDMYATVRSNQFKLFVGKQSGIWLFEAGGGSLARYWSHNQGLIPGRGEGCCYIKQKIYTYNIYGVAGVSLPLTKRISVFGAGGYTFVWGKNREYGSNENGTGIGHTNTVHNFAPIFMAGVKYQINDRLRLRFDYTTIDNVARSHWTLHSDIKAYGLGVDVSF